MYRLKTYFTRILALAAIIAGSMSCTAYELDYDKGKKKVFIIYSCGFNNLSHYLKKDIEEVMTNFRPLSAMDVVMIYSHQTKKHGDYSIPTEPVLFQLRLDRQGAVKADTLKVYPETTNSASPETFRHVLDFIRTTHPDSDYGILLSSHSTGWMPQDYCNDPGAYDPKADSDSDFEWASLKKVRKRLAPTWGVQLPDGSPVVKSFGVQNTEMTDMMYEMDITDMAESIPMKMDFIIFDSCLMGGIEVAYEFKDICRYMIFSQTEILADGMDYEKLPSRVFMWNESSIRQICQDYYNQYIVKDGTFRSATISMIDCRRLGPLASICREIFESQRAEIAALEDSEDVQIYYRPELKEYHKWYHDLESIVSHAGTPHETMIELRNALNTCVLYKAATERFMNAFYINEHCGLSMYLPYEGYDYLNSFYKTLEWNKATGLIQ